MLIFKYSTWLLLLSVGTTRSTSLEENKQNNNCLFKYSHHYKIHKKVKILIKCHVCILIM